MAGRIAAVTLATRLQQRLWALMRPHCGKVARGADVSALRHPRYPRGPDAQVANVARMLYVAARI